MEPKEAWKKVDELKKHPELANTPGYEVFELREAVNPGDWFFLLMEQPQFEPGGPWWFELRHRGDLPWAKLLALQPQFENRVHWESVSRLELMKLGYLAPAIFKRRFPQGRPWDLYAFLTPLEKKQLLIDVPHLENKMDWDALSEEWTDGDWLTLLAYQPQFEGYFEWSRIEKKPSPYWDLLLRRQPQFADHCDFALLNEGQIRRILYKQPQFANRCDWSKLTPEDREKLEAKGIRP